MKAELKRVHSPDINDLENYRPDNPAKFSFLIQAMIGPEGGAGEESFDIEVCTPKWLEETCDLHDVVIGRHRLIVREYIYVQIIQAINNYLKGCTGENWNEVAGKVARLGRWEFEDYVE